MKDLFYIVGRIWLPCRVFFFSPDLVSRNVPILNSTSHGLLCCGCSFYTCLLFALVFQSCYRGLSCKSLSNVIIA